MSFGKDLSHEFQKLTQNGEFQEVELITKLQDAFINLAKGKYHYAIDIIHGSRSFVDFEYNASWLQNVSSGETFTRELSDMMFLVFSKKHKHIRLMYMQNKKGDSSTKFKADLLQLCLLKKRCVISSPNLPGCTFGDSRILADSLLPSVGSYGVFYNINDVTEMAYYPASNVSPVTGFAASTNRKAYFSYTRFGITETKGRYEENQGEENLEFFSDALVGMEIGTPITKKHPLYRSIVLFLREKSRCFLQSGFEKDFDYPKDRDSQRFAAMPFICVINAEALIENDSAERLKRNTGYVEM